MATSKTTTKKPVAAKATKKPAAARKAPVKTTAAKVRATKAIATPRKASKKSPAAMQSFRVYRNDESFTTFRVTRQTVYWVVLVAFIVFAQLWILKLQVEISTLLQQQQDSILIEE